MTLRPEDAAAHIQAIRAMVDRSRSDRARTGDIYVAWGVIVGLALLLHAGLDLYGSATPWIAWPVLAPIGMGYAAWRGRQEAGQAITYASRVEARLWMIVGLVLLVLCIGGPMSGTLPLRAITPVVSGVIAVGLGTSSELYRYRPLGYAGTFFVVVALVSLYLPWQAQFALMGVALLLGYVVPGVMMTRAARADG